MPRKNRPTASRTRAGRKKSGAKSAIDTGTPELRAKRMLIVGTRPDELRDQTLSTCPLDALLARRLISEEAHAAAVHFRACRARVFGSPHVRACDPLRAQGHEFTGDAGQAEAAYRIACEELRRRNLLAPIEDLVVHELWPWWMMAGGGKRTRAQRCVGHGLSVLVAWHRSALRSETRGGLVGTPWRGQPGRG